MRSTQHKTNLLIIQSTAFCNINCSYCYLPDRLLKGQFPISMAAGLMNNLVESDLLGERLDVCWHAGEPLVLKPSYYEAFILELRRFCPESTQMTFNFQTNGTLITQEYCDFIKRYNITVGVSIDGPEFINDYYRKDRKDKGTFKKVLNGINLLKSNNIDFSVISVLTDYSLNYPKEIYDFFRSLGPKTIGFNCEEIESANTTSSLSEDDSKKYYNFFNTISHYDERQNIDSPPAPGIRELEIYKPLLQDKKTSVGNSLTHPFFCITVDIKGNFSTFSPELIGANSDRYPSFILGNVNDGLIVDAQETKLFKQIHNEIKEGINNCRTSCKYFRYCGGGTPSNKHSEKNDFSCTETTHCKLAVQSIVNALTMNNA